MSGPVTLAEPCHSELVVKKSRFIACVQPVADRARALEVVAGLRSLHPDAAHVCWALMAGGHSAASDDGEPGGTAGRPMLNVLRHQELEGVLATVVRYFGGVKLGAGGLVRAYTDSVAQALLSAPKVVLEKHMTLACALPYAMEGWLRRELELAQATLGEVVHGEQVRVAFSLSEARAADLVSRLNEAGHGKLVWLEPEDATADDDKSG